MLLPHILDPAIGIGFGVLAVVTHGDGHGAQLDGQGGLALAFVHGIEITAQPGNQFRACSLILEHADGQVAMGDGQAGGEDRGCSDRLEGE